MFGFLGHNENQCNFPGNLVETKFLHAFLLQLLRFVLASRIEVTGRGDHTRCQTDEKQGRSNGEAEEKQGRSKGEAEEKRRSNS